MGTFTIKFEGIICHVGKDRDTKDRSVVVFDSSNEHVATIEVPGEPTFGFLDGDTVTFPNLPGGPANTDSSFKSLTPPLSDLIDSGSVLTGVASGSHTNNDGVLAFVELPAGDLSVPDIFDRPADFAFADDTFKRKQCVGKGVVLTTDDGGTNVEILITRADGTTKSFTVRPGTTVEILNVSSITSPTSHFQLYEQLLNAPEVAFPREDAKLKCKAKTSSSGIKFTAKQEAMREQGRKRGLKGRDVELLIPNPDCSNSSWP